MTPPDRRLAWSLAAMRLTAGAFLLVWSLQKLIVPETAQGVFGKFYDVVPPETVVVILGVIQTAIILAFMAGILKTLSYGAVLAFHTVSTLTTVPLLADPYTSPNALFWAAIPLVALFAALFLLRDQDRFLTLGSKQVATHGSPETP